MVAMQFPCNGILVVLVLVTNEDLFLTREGIKEKVNQYFPSSSVPNFRLFLKI